jgi:hypothetical protein
LTNTGANPLLIKQLQIWQLKHMDRKGGPQQNKTLKLEAFPSPGITVRQQTNCKHLLVIQSEDISNKMVGYFGNRNNSHVQTKPYEQENH